MKPRLIITNKCGRLGNRLTLLAHVLATAMDHGGHVVDLGFDEYADLFACTAKRPVVRLPAPVLRVAGAGRVRSRLYGWGRLLREGSRTSRWLRRMSSSAWLTLPTLGDHCHLDTAEGAAAMQTLRDHRTTFLDGWWFRNAPAVRRHAGRLRELFVPAPGHAAAVARVLAAARQEVDVLIGLHIRREDYRTARPQWVFEDETYVGIMQRLGRLLDGQRCGFLIASPEPVQLAEPDVHRLHRASGQIVEDLYTLAGCDYLVGVPSTFCQWASFHGEVPYFVLTEAVPTFSLADFKVCEVPWGT